MFVVRGAAVAGLIGVADPVKETTPAALAALQGDGIEIVMVTGDNRTTAEAVARHLGIDAVEADVLPEDKNAIVTRYREAGRTVAMAGDGVNDAPALKSADVGVAMGKNGTDVAREAAQVILLDDNFASIVAGIEEGRTIFANIRKFTNYVLVSNGPEIVPYLLYMLFPVPLALTVIQILSIDLGTDIVPSMALGQEKPDGQTMKEPPRSAKQGLLTLPVIAHSYLFLGLIEAAFSMSLFFWVLFDGGWTWGAELATDDPLYHSATGIALSSILLMQIGNLFGRRSRFGSGLDRHAFANRLIVFGVVFEIVFSWAILYAPWVGTILGTGPVATEVYLTAWLGVPLIFGLDYIRKRVAWRLAGRPE